MATNGAQKKEEVSVSSAVWESFREEVTSEMDLVDEQKFSEYRNRKGPARQVERKCKGRGAREAGWRGLHVGRRFCLSGWNPGEVGRTQAHQPRSRC